MNTLDKFIKNCHHIRDLHDLQRETLLKLIEALIVKEYKTKNPENKSVILVSYYLKDKDSKVLDKHPTFECVASNNHKRIDRLQRKYFSQYRKLTFKSYDLTKIMIDKKKVVAVIQKDVTNALNK